METRLADATRATPEGQTADAILRACVHCGFCNATCPTYQLLGDELDGPRGRIYQIKQVLEGAPATATTQLHLDRCLTCRNCETTCPSGVQYGHLLDIGRAAVEAQVSRPVLQRALHALLRATLSRRWLFAPALRIGRTLRFVLPDRVRAKIGRARPAGAWPHRAHARKILLMRGCTQPAMLPSIDAATARVLDAIGIETLIARQAGCCGAIRQHLNDPPGALAQLRTNIDAWWPHVSAGRVEALIINASGCAVTVKEYGYLLRNDARYADKARRISECARDLTEFLLPEVDALRSHLETPSPGGVVLQTPCTLQHGQQLAGRFDELMTGLGVRPLPAAESHLCCGSAGTYSLLQDELSIALRDRKLSNLQATHPRMILSANIGCISHLQSGTDTPVWHWIEWLDHSLKSAQG